MNKKEKTIFWTINTDMIKKLELKGLELLLFALINNFTQDEEGEFYGRISWLASTLNVSRQAVGTAISKLLEKQLIKKIERKNQTHFRINKLVIDREIKKHNETILHIECKESLHSDNRASHKDKIYSNEYEEGLHSNNKGSRSDKEASHNSVEKFEGRCKQNSYSDVKKLDIAGKESLHSDVKKLDIECKESLHSSYIYLNLYKTYIFKFILEKNIEEQFEDLFLKIHERFTCQTTTIASKTTSLYSQIINAVKNRKYDLNDCIIKSYEIAIKSVEQYRWHNFCKEILRLLNQGGADIKKHKTESERKADELKKIERQKKEDIKKEIELKKIAESEKEALKLGLTLEQYNILNSIVFSFSIENKLGFDQDFGENIKIFIDAYPNYKDIVEEEQLKINNELTN